LCAELPKATLRGEFKIVQELLFIRETSVGTPIVECAVATRNDQSGRELVKHMQLGSRKPTEPIGHL
jgi:hypothetical protein